MHEKIRTLLSVINTVVIVLGAGVAYREFVWKSATSESVMAEETINRAQKISEEGGFLLEYLFDDNLAPQGLLAEKSTGLAEKFDRALGAYFSIALCIEIGRCDPKIAARLICPPLLLDAFVVNRVVGSRIEKGTPFIDRQRIWSFYEQVEFCRDNTDDLKIGHDSFRARFQKEIDLLSRADAVIFDKLQKRGN